MIQRSLLRRAQWIVRSSRTMTQKIGLADHGEQILLIPVELLHDRNRVALPSSCILKFGSRAASGSRIRALKPSFSKYQP